MAQFISFLPGDAIPCNDSENLTGQGMQPRLDPLLTLLLRFLDNSLDVKPSGPSSSASGDLFGLNRGYIHLLLYEYIYRYVWRYILEALYDCMCVCRCIYIYRKDDLFPTSRDPTTMILGHDPEKRRIGTKSTWPKKRCKEKTMAIHKRDSSPPT